MGWAGNTQIRTEDEIAKRGGEEEEEGMRRGGAESQMEEEVRGAGDVRRGG